LAIVSSVSLRWWFLRLLASLGISACDFGGLPGGGTPGWRAAEGL